MTGKFVNELQMKASYFLMTNVTVLFMRFRVHCKTFSLVLPLMLQ